MKDREDITEVLVRYATGIDSRDWQLFSTCFTDDCKLDYGNMGKWDSADAVTDFMRGAHSGPSLHRLTNFVITVAGDQASARTYVEARVHHNGGIAMHTDGYYDDELVRTAEGWRIAHRNFTVVGMEFMGPLSILPAGIVKRLAAFGARKANEKATR